MMILDIWALRHKEMWALHLTLTRKGLWITIGPFTLRIVNESRKLKSSVPVEFSAGFGMTFHWPYMEIGRSSFDVKDGTIIMENMY